MSPAIQDDLRKGFAALGADDTPMVRRAAAKWLGVRELVHYRELISETRRHSLY